MSTDLNVEINYSEYSILVVDDVISNVLLLKVLLAAQKFNVITASNGMEAIDITKKQQPDLILLDVMMPGMSGFEVAQKLKNDPEVQHIPIIFLTALNSTADIVTGFKVGANDFISKPFNKEELVIRVNHQISLIAAKRIILQKTEELKKTIQGRDKMYSVIAHDLRSPLGSIKMVLNMFVMTMSPQMIGEEQYEMLDSANKSTEELFTLLDNLLKWTKTQTGRLTVVFQDFELVKSISGVFEIFSLVSSSKNIELIFDSNEEINVRGDIDMVKTITRNLLSNAIKFSFSGSKIIIEVKKIGNMAVVSVKDFGKGMSQEEQQKLFNSETHFSKYGTNNEEGSGLGLLLCKDFATKNRGDLWLQSEEGKGSTFFFSVPLKDN
ncbi:hybrid sensor histidine kinase/response regulator [Phocaeicola paurosaccharolyticus]|jgi:two-component system, sensor histidine kinase and response regulator|uniref:hybrid sensor histidine kinase/response regulator n=1 Tax=Phocaeicola paurosaccharolyticus TaxID=732242 RepID=UPI000469D22D|nr:hybrid sensor histidine kinase/response regulator [Phocaeicola paurosaccharolyticus]